MVRVPIDVSGTSFVCKRYKITVKHQGGGIGPSGILLRLGTLSDISLLTKLVIKKISFTNLILEPVNIVSDLVVPNTNSRLFDDFEGGLSEVGASKYYSTNPRFAVVTRNIPYVTGCKPLLEF